MRVGPEPLHLTYCTNIHAGETWDEIRTNLDRYVLPEEYRREDIVSAVARELNWVRDRLVS